MSRARYRTAITTTRVAAVYAPPDPPEDFVMDGLDKPGRLVDSITSSDQMRSASASQAYRSPPNR